MKKSLASLTLVAACCAVSLASFTPSIAHGQAAAASQYRSVPPKQWASRQEESRLLLDVREIIRGGAPLDQANKDKLTTYFNQFLFPQMTAFDDQSLSEMPKRRQSFIAMTQKGFSIDQAAHDFIVDMTMKTMQQIALGDFHPAVRYNAMLIIGTLNSQEAGLSAQKQPPVPLKEALPILLRELSNPDQIEVVRVAALLGVHRHARLERENSKLNRTQFNDADIRQLIDSMLEVVRLEQPPAGRSEEGHDWMRRRAIEVLAEIGKVDAGGSVATEIEKVVTSDDASDSLRCGAARAIGKLSFTTVQNFDAAGVATKLGQFAVHCCQQEIDRVAQLKKEQEERELREQLALQGPAVRGGRGERQPGGGERAFNPFGDPAFGSLLGEEEEAEWQMVVSKRRLKYQLGSIRTALAGSPAPPSTGQPTPTTGLLQRASGAQKASVNEIVVEVDRLLSALDASVTTQEDLLKGVSSNMTKLADLVGANSGSESIPGLGPATGGPTPAPGDPDSPNTPVPGAPAPGAPVPGGPVPGAPAPGAPQPGAPAPGAPAPGAPRPGV